MNVLICDERRDVRRVLLDTLAGVPRVRTAEAVCAGDELLARYSAARPAAVFTGDAPATLAAVEALLARHSDAAVLVAVTTMRQPALPVGVRGCFALSSAGPGLCAALIALLGPASPNAESSDTEPSAGPTHPAHIGAPHVPARSGAELSVRELEVLYGICRGRSNLEIGRELFLAEQTVKVYVRSLFRKLGVQHRAQAVAHGFRAGLID